MPLQPTARRALVVLGILVAVPLALLVGALLLVESEWSERWVEKRVAGLLEREVQLENVDVKLGWPLGVAAQRLRISNPPWASTPNLVDAHGLDSLVEIPPLFAGRFVLPYVGAQSAAVGLEREGKRATWRFGTREGEGEAKLLLQRVALQQGKIHYADKDEDTALDLDVAGSLGAQRTVEFKGSGKFRGEPAQGSGKIPSLEPTPGRPIPVIAKATFGKTEVSVDGTVAPDLSKLHFDFGLAGKSLDDLRKLFRLNLPETPPYKVKGHLKREGTTWAFGPLNGTVGDSDVHGTVKITKGPKRPLFQANLHSKLLDFDDLGPLIGAPPKTGPGETASAEQKQKAAVVSTSPRVIPRAKFSVERWDEMDADVRLQANKVMRPKQLPLDTFSTHLVLKDSVMRLQPLSFGVAGGKINADITLNATKKPTQGQMDVQVQGLQFSKLFPTAKSMDQSLGTLYGGGKLKGQGESVGDLLATSDGNFGLAVDGGQVSLLLVELLGLDLAEAVMLLGTRNRQVGLRCAAGGFEVNDGIATPKSFVVDTTDTVVKVEGTVNLGQEKIALVTHPEPKDRSIFALRSPIRIEGQFRDPDVKPKVGPIAARVAGAVALAALNPALAILPFIETGPGKDTDCGKLLADARSQGANKVKVSER